MFKKVIQTAGFWKSVVFLGVLFALVYDIIILWFDFGFDIGNYVHTYFANAQSVLKFLVANVLGGFLYGFIITFGKFRAKLKEQERKQNP